MHTLICHRSESIKHLLHVLTYNTYTVQWWNSLKNFLCIGLAGCFFKFIVEQCLHSLLQNTVTRLLKKLKGTLKRTPL